MTDTLQLREGGYSAVLEDEATLNGVVRLWPPYKDLPKNRPECSITHSAAGAHGCVALDHIQANQVFAFRDAAEEDLVLGSVEEVYVVGEPKVAENVLSTVLFTNWARIVSETL